MPYTEPDPIMATGSRVRSNRAQKLIKALEANQHKTLIVPSQTIKDLYLSLGVHDSRIEIAQADRTPRLAYVRS